MTRYRLLFALALMLLPIAARAQNKPDYPRFSPFTDVDGSRVLYEGAWYECVDINGLTLDEIMGHCLQHHGVKAEQRFAEDLIQVLTEMGSPPGAAVSLKLLDPATGAVRAIDRAEMTNKNRDSVRTARRARAENQPRPAQNKDAIPRHDAAADLKLLERLLDDTYAYATLRAVDYRGELKQWRDALPEQVTRADLALGIAKLLARFGDGHTRVDGLENDLPRAYAPFLCASVGDRIVAFKPDRSGFLDDNARYIASIDGVPIERWLDQARAFTARGAPSYTSFHAPRMLRHLVLLRRELGLPETAPVRVLLVSSSADPQEPSVEMVLPLADRYPTFGDWPRSRTRVLNDNIGYLRIAEMTDANNEIAPLHEAIEQFRGADGLIIDVRGNGGGSRRITTELLPYFLPPAEPLLVNIAKYRMPRGTPDDPEGYLADRYLFPITSKFWELADSAHPDQGIAGERIVLRDWVAQRLDAFKPRADVGPGPWSPWHAMVIAPSPDRARYTKPVVVLMDSACFSATDIFLAAFKGLPNVTLMGQTSGGGSGRAISSELAYSDIKIRLSSMASYRPDGELYDGVGIEPDVPIDFAPTDLLGQTDTVLDAAVERLKRASR